MAPCLSKFPSVCLEGIFKHVPLAELIRSIGLVCSSWYGSRGTELARRRCLRLVAQNEHENLGHLRVHQCWYGTELIERVRRDDVDGSPWHTLETLEQYQFNCLSVPDRNQVTFYWSLDILSNITSLNLQLDCTAIGQVIRLINRLAERLVELRLELTSNHEGFDIEDNAVREHALNETNVIDCLNRLMSLRHLNLELSNLASSAPLLSCLARLGTFAIRGAFFGLMDGWLLASIERYGTQNKLTSIEVYNTVKLRAMLQLDAQLATKFKVLSVSYGGDDGFTVNGDDIAQAISQFGARFSCLTQLELRPFGRMSHLPMTKLARCLTSLTQLVHLQLRFPDIPQVEGHVEDEFEEQVQPIAQVPSVRMLSIRVLNTNSHRDTERLFVAEIYPYVQVLRFEYKAAECTLYTLHCTDCDIDQMYGFDDEAMDPVEARRIAECKRLTLQPFLGCSHLHTFALVNTVLNEEVVIELEDM